MATVAERDTELGAGLERWWAEQGAEPVHVTELARPATGWSNETLLVTTSPAPGGAERRGRVVVRLPPSTPPIHPTYDLAAQARVLEVARDQGIPVPRVLAYEADARWMGAPFLVMSFEPGRPGGETPALDPWIADAPPGAQRRLHDGFVAALATIHRVDWKGSGLDDVLRGGTSMLASEIAWWANYVDWATDGSPPPALVDAVAWCRSTAPGTEPEASLCWGDARIGNVLFTDERRVAAVLDWEMATIGPAETDLGWYLALDALSNHFTGRAVAGFPARAEAVAQYQQALGRDVVDLEWHEIFALTRSVAISDRLARVAAAERGVDFQGIAGDDNPMLRYLTHRIERFPTGGTP